MDLKRKNMAKLNILTHSCKVKRIVEKIFKKSFLNLNFSIHIVFVLNYKL